MIDMIELDGAHGGGQLLRSALSLSLCTGTGFTLRNIRGARTRPGLLRQHLTAVLAAATVGEAAVHGAELGSTTLRFEPRAGTPGSGAIAGGDYRFATGSAGSTTLVLQTVLPALWQAQAPSTLRLEGGTHNPMAPSADFLCDTFLPVLRTLGVDASLELEAHGFHPAGGGVLHARVAPSRPRVAHLEERGALLGVQGIALLSALSAGIGHRELAVLAQRLGLAEDALELRSVRPAIGPGNAVMVRVQHAAHTETFTGFGARGLAAETVAERVAQEAEAYLASSAFAGEHLADQLLLPMALAGAGSFTTVAISDHLVSNARLIEKFLPVEIEWAQVTGSAWRVEVRG